MKKRLFWILAILMAWFGRDGARAQQRQPVTSVQPDCMVFFNLTVASSGAQAAVNSAGTSGLCDDHQVGAYGWTVAYTSHGFTALSLVLQSAPDNAGGTAPGTWATVAVCGGTECLGINPNTSTTSAVTTTKVIAPWFRVNLTSKTGTGGVVGVLYGYKVNIVAGGPAPIPPAVSPGAPVNSLQYNCAGAFCGASQDLYNSATGTLTFSNPTNVALMVRNDVGMAGLVDSRPLQSFVNNTSSGAITGAYGFTVGVFNASTGTITKAYGISVETPVNNSTGTIGTSYGLFLSGFSNPAGPATTDNFAIWSDDQNVTGVTNSYFLWYDTAGVYRIKADGVMAYYNPAFTKYTPGAVDFERVVQQWNTNVLEYGTEAGGTGTLRRMRFLGVSIELPVSTFANLGTPSNATEVYCSNCTVTSSVDNTCATGGTGAFGERINGAWKCQI